MIIVMMGLLLLPVGSWACGVNSHPDQCHGAICGTETQVLNWLQQQGVDMARDYKKEYREYHGTPEQKKKRAARGRARYDLEQRGVVRKGDGKDVHHKNGNPLDNRRANLQPMSPSKNRGKK